MPPDDASTIADIPSDPKSNPRYAAGERVGAFTIIRLLGVGGMGEVYEAEQREPVRRQVALKVIKLGMDSKAVVARFEAERQALALMDHPGVARVFDGGVFDNGRPYFAMELVKGLSITEHCDKHRLGIEERVKLMIKVCDAVQHAHTKGVVHRDLKPSNILVEYLGDKRAVKVIDFGVAKALNQRLVEATVFTEFGQMIGTPEYMSPEQAEMSGQDIDTRSDIYSLGVLFYEILTGFKPFEAKAMREAGLAEIHRIIREVEPSKPSTRLTTLLSEEATAKVVRRIAEARHIEPQKLTGILKRDLDWVVMKCLEKDRVRRYETANALSMELGRYLSEEPVLAGPPSLSYRVRKFVQRNRWQVAAVGALLGALALGVAGSTAGLVWALNERSKAKEAEVEQRLSAEAEAEARVAADLATADSQRALQSSKAVNGVLYSLLFQATPGGIAQGDTSVYEKLVDKASWQIDHADLTTEAERELRLMIADILLRLGRHEDAQIHEVAIRGTFDASTDPREILRIETRLASGHYFGGKIEDRIEHFEPIVNALGSVLAPSEVRRAEAYTGLGSLQKSVSDYEGALASYEEALRAPQETFPKTNNYRYIALEGVAFAEGMMGDPLEAIQTLERLYLEQFDRYGDGWTEYGRTLGDLEKLYKITGDVQGLERTMLRDLEHTAQAWGPNGEYVIKNLSRVASFYEENGNVDRAYAFRREASRRAKDRFGPMDGRVLYALRELARADLRQGNTQSAVQWLERLESKDAFMLEDSPKALLDAIGTHVDACYRAGYTERALALLKLTKNQFATLSDPIKAEYGLTLSWALLRTGMNEDAIDVSSNAIRILDDADPANLNQLIHYHRQLGRAHANLEQEKPTYAMYREAYELSLRPGAGLYERIVARVDLAWHYSNRRKNHEQGSMLLKEAIEVQKIKADEKPVSIAWNHRGLAVFAKRSEDLDRAEEHIRTAIEIGQDDANFLQRAKLELGEILHEQGEDLAALEIYDALSSDSEFRQRVGQLQWNRAISLHALGRLDKAVEAAMQAANEIAAEDNPDSRLYLHILNKCSGWLEHAGDPRAIEYRSRDVSERIRIDGMQAKSTMWSVRALGRLHERAGDDAKAIELYDRLIMEIVESHAESEVLASTLLHRGRSLYRLRRWDEAESDLMRSEEIYRVHVDSRAPILGEVLYFLVKLYEDRDDLEDEATRLNTLMSWKMKRDSLRESSDAAEPQ